MKRTMEIKRIITVFCLITLATTSYSYTFRCVGFEKNHSDDTKTHVTKNIIIDNDLSKINYKPAKEVQNKQYIYTEEEVKLNKNEKIMVKSYFNPNFLTYNTSIEQDGKALISTESNCELLKNPFMDKK
ncbi:hypothetical protein L3V79_02405 [Thiotrichales bacterium 19S9-12]|nr:hypothetical protein [Thiotrichales bacterium 19S9-11]MCF6811209.1 hypothetical protein [Thiotrichales bacterium 19S9-12]